MNSSLLIVGGEEDPLITPDSLRQVQAVAAQTKLVLYPEAGHLAWYQYMDNFTALLEKFLVDE